MVNIPICIICCIGFPLVIEMYYLIGLLFTVTLAGYLLILSTLLTSFILLRPDLPRYLLRSVRIITTIIALGLLLSYLAVLIARALSL